MYVYVNSLTINIKWNEGLRHMPNSLATINIGWIEEAKDMPHLFDSNKH